MDYLKTDAVLWKREGARWLEATSKDKDRARAWETPDPEEKL